MAIKRGGAETPGGPLSSRHAQGARGVGEAQARDLQGEIIAGSGGGGEDAEATAARTPRRRPDRSDAGANDR